MAEKDIQAWREALAAEPEAKKYGELMFKSMEKDVFDELQGYITENGRDLAEKIWCYAECKGYDISEEEILNGFKTALPNINSMVERAWEQALGVYFHAQIKEGEAAKAKQQG
jgi:hypothetical protein